MSRCRNPVAGGLTEAEDACRARAKSASTTPPAIAACALLALTGAVLFGPALRAQQPVTPSSQFNRQGRQTSLYDQLRVGLKATTKADLEFINLVVLKVNQGDLPRKLVDSTFLWARNRYKTRPANHRLRPMVYFQPALIMRAKKHGVLL